MVRRHVYLESLASMLGDEVVVTNLGIIANEWGALRPHQANLYSVGMGLVTPLALGVAMARPDMRVISLDGDGSLALELSVLATIGKLRPANLTVIAFDNHTYESIGQYPTDTASSLDLVAAAKASGISDSTRISSERSFMEAMTAAMVSKEPQFVCVEIEPGSFPSGKPQVQTMYGRANKVDFVRFVEKKEGIKILKPFYP